jgi:hypothetical protein
VTAAGSGLAALERLAIALGPQFITVFVHQAGHRPCLAVVDRETRAAAEVYADDNGRLWWPWAERITDDPLAAAHQVTAALRGTVAAGGQR